MSNFYAYDFIFDNIPSQTFDIKIMSLDSEGVIGGVGSSDVNIITQRVLRKSKPYYLGRTQEPVLEFPLMFGSPNEIDAIDRDIISKWLFGRKGYKKLYILQDDLQGLYFNCFLTKPEPIYIGNINYAFQCTVVCDSPWAYGEPRKYEITPSDVQEQNHFYFYNASSEDDYIYPKVTIWTDGTSDMENYRLLRFQNLSESNRNTRYRKLLETDIIEINNDLQTIKSNYYSSSNSYMQYFNKNWLRLLPGRNHFVWQAVCIEKFEVYYIERFKVGG